MAYCQNDRMMSGAFDCYCLQREVYNYRMAHANDAGAPEPLADLFAKDKLNSAGCIGQFVDDVGQESGAVSVANTSGR